MTPGEVVILPADDQVVIIKNPISVVVNGLVLENVDSRALNDALTNCREGSAEE